MSSVSILINTCEAQFCDDLKISYNFSPERTFAGDVFWGCDVSDEWGKDRYNTCISATVELISVIYLFMSTEFLYLYRPCLLYILTTKQCASMNFPHD